MRSNQSIYIAGPTAVGKSAVAMIIAERLRGEIISVDSMQVYRGLDIGTAKPSDDERSRVPHHLIDVAEPAAPFDAAQFCALATKAERDIHSRGRVAVFCGGTGLYFRAYLEGLGAAPPADPDLRRQLQLTPVEELLDELQQRDPQTFAAIDKNNPRRVVRAVEVIRLTGKPFSEQRATWKAAASPQLPAVVLNRDRDELVERISQRVDAMFAAGLVEETRSLLSQGLASNPTALQAIGYRQVVEHLRGEHTLDQTIELVKIKTRQFAKRQLTWFRAQLNARWFQMTRGESTEAVADRVLPAVNITS